MSLSPYFYLEKWNEKTKSYEKISLYKKPSEYATKAEKERGWEEVDFWPWNGTHEIFSLLGTSSKSDVYDLIEGVHCGIPPFVSDEIKSDIDDVFTEEEGYYSANASVRWVTLADLYIEKLSHPKLLDYDAEWEDDKKVYKDNPINTVINRINTFISLGANDWEVEDNKSLIRLVYWTLW